MALTKSKRERKREHAVLWDSKVKLKLQEHNKNSSRKHSAGRKKTPEEIKDLIDTKLYQPEWFIRNPEDWKATSYNSDKQIVDFCKWVYCKYIPPLFLFSIFSPPCKDQHGTNLKRYVPNSKATENEFFFDWFITISNGYPFAKSVSDLLTKKESHIFLNLKTSGTVKENFWRAKCIADKLSPKLTNFFIKRLSDGHWLWDNFWHEAIKFFARFQNEIDINNLSDLCDFINASRRGSKTFSLKDRTYLSLIKASNQWHREQHLKSFGNINISWEGLPISDWEFIQPKTETCWKIKQLFSSKELYQEGKIMRHCVASYVTQCKAGHSYIFSLRKKDIANTEEHVVTIEVNSHKEIVQVRERYNKLPDDSTYKIVEKWATQNSLKNSYLKWRGF